MKPTPFILCLLAVIAGLVYTTAAEGHGGERGQTVRIVARLLEDGRVEFGLRTAEDTLLPRRRFFPSSVSGDDWKRSTLIELSDGTQVRIIARQTSAARVEFGLRIEEPTREFLPTRRFFSRTSTVDRWASSTPILLPAPADVEHERAVEHEAPATDDTAQARTPESAPTTEPVAGSSVERISAGHRDGLIVEGSIIGDPDAAVLIVEYGDPF